MSNSIMTHIEYEDASIYVSEISKRKDDVECMNISLGYSNTIFLTPVQAEKLFRKLDKQLHESTMTSEYMKNEISEMEDKIYSLEIDLEDANDRLESFEDKIS